VAEPASAFACSRAGGGCGSLRRVPGEPLADDASGLRAANAGLRAVPEAKDAENALPRAELDAGNHPGYALGTWLREYKEQVFLFTRVFAVSWTNNVSERGAKAAKRHQAVSGYRHSLATLGRWCRLRSYLDSAAAHGTTALDAISSAITGNPWLPPLPALA
jgi:hypothetical protein